MLDENLPTFLFRPMPDHPSSAVVYFTRSGSDPAPEYVLRLADPATQPACRGVYAAALTDPYHSSDVVYAEAAVAPEWQLPTLSAAELREQREQRERRERRGSSSGHAEPAAAAAAAPVAKTPDAFTVQLYNPDQAVVVRWTPGSWNRTESWEFDMPVESFRMPSASRLDRQQAAAAAAAAGPTASTSAAAAAAAAAAAPAALTADAVAPKNTFRWKRDGRLANKDMTCYLVGTSVGLHRSKEPDITVALFKHGRDPAVTIYEPNLQRVDVQDRKGLDLVLLLGTQVIRDLYLVPRADPFNMEGAAAAAAAGSNASRRKNSRPTAAMSVTGLPAPSSVAPVTSSPPRPVSAYNSVAPASSSSASSAAAAAAAAAVPSAAAIDAETKRLQAMLEREERERARREREEEKRIKKMLEAEDRERRKRDAEVAKETERLRKLYGVQGQDLPSMTSAAGFAAPAAPAAPAGRPVPPPPPPPPPINSNGYAYLRPALPPRPVSVGPGSVVPPGHHQDPAVPGSYPHSQPYGRRPSSGFLSNPAATVSGFFSSSSSSGGGSGGRERIHKKRSVHF